MESARRWSGYVCPDCRFVFRVPRDHDGKGLVCPSCRRMLRIPTAADHPQPLLAPLGHVVPYDRMAQENPVKPASSRRRKLGGTGDYSWEHAPSSSRTHRGEQRRMRMMLIGGGLLFLVIVAGVVVSMIGGKVPVVAVRPVAPPPVVREPQRTTATLVGEAEALARKFLNAATVDEMLTTVRNPELAESRMRKFYPGGKIETAGMSTFNSGAGLVTRGKLHSFPVMTRDHEEKSLAFIETPQGLKIDWESWVGWSDIPWTEFLSTKPAGSHVFRVIVASVDYYNFGFSDDSKWQSYRLESPGREHAVYGYAEKNSALNANLRPGADGQTVLMTLELKFPPDAKSDSQVEIERLVHEGWMEEGDAP